MAVEQPLRGIVGIGLGQAVGVFLGRNLLPMGEVEGNLYKGRIGDIELLIDPPHFASERRRTAEAPDGG